MFLWIYTDYAGPEISVNSRIASPFSRQIAMGNAGPSTALQSMGANLSFRCHILNIAPIYENLREKVLSRPQKDSEGNHFLLRHPDLTGGPGTPFSPIAANAIWDQHFRFSRP